MVIHHIVGRQTHWKELGKRWTGALASKGHTIIVTAPAGGGKTSLIRQFGKSITMDHIWIEATAYPSPNGVVYSPIIEALDRIFRNQSQSTLQELFKGLPELNQLFPRVQQSPHPSFGSPTMEKVRLMTSFSLLVERMAQEQPVVLFFDDLHWADSATIALFHFLARGLEQNKVLLIAAIRQEELSSSCELRQSIQSLRRIESTYQIALEPLNHEEITQLFVNRCGAPPNRELRSLLIEKTGGSPFFVHTVIDALQSKQQLHFDGCDWCLLPQTLPLPNSVSTLVQERLERIPLTAREVLECLALSPNGISHKLLCALVSQSEQWIDEQVQALQASGFVQQLQREGEIIYKWVHPLMQEAVYQHLPPLRRRQLHASFAELMTPSQETLFRLANHYCGMDVATLEPDAFEIVYDAGVQARQLGAHTEATHYLQTALVAARKQPTQERLPRLLEQLGELQLYKGDQAAAQRSLLEAQASYLEQHHTAGIARTHRLLSHVCWGLLQFDQAQQHINEGLASISQAEEQEEWERLQGARLMFFDRLYAFDQIQRMLGELSQIQYSLSPHFRISMGISILGSFMRSGRYTQAEEQVTSLLNLAHETNDWHQLLRVQNFAGLIALAQGNHMKTEEYITANLSLIKRHALILFEPSVLAVGAITAFVKGDWEQALQLAAKGMSIAESIGLHRYHSRFYGICAFLHALQGDNEKARLCISKAKQIHGERTDDIHAAASLWLGEATAALENNEIDEAQRTLEQLPQTHDLLHLDCTVVSLFLQCWGQIYIHKQDLPKLCVVIKQFRQSQTHSTYCAAWADYFEAARHKLYNEPKQALVLFDQAARKFETLAIPFDLARAEMAWLSLSQTKAEVSQQTWQARWERCFLRFQRLSAHNYTSQMKALLPQTHPTIAATQPTPPLFSPREQDVIIGIVEGLSNKEIAQKLHISHHTVNTHLKRIYARLELHSRLELHQYAIKYMDFDIKSA